MKKIPVFETIAHAYGFAIGNFLRVLGIVWAPLAVLIAVGLMVTPGFIGNHMPVNDPDEVARQSLRLVPAIFLLSLFIRAMIGVGVTELALGKRGGVPVVYFSLAAPVWRLFGAWLLFLLVMILIYIGLIILTIVVGIVGGIAVKAAALSQGMNEVAVALLLAFCAVLFVGALLYVMARLTFLIPPVVVNEGKIDLARGWELTKGSFWRILWIGIAIFIPLIVVQVGALLFLYGPEMFQHFAALMHAAFQGQLRDEALRQQMDVWSAAARTRGLQIWPYTSAVTLIVGTFAYGLLFSASAFAYREITETPASPLRDPI